MTMSAYLEAVCTNATVALLIMDEHQQCVYMNPAAVLLTGYTLAEVQGRPLHDVIHHSHPDGSPYPLADCPIDRAFPENMQEQGEDVFIHKDGHFYDVSFTASPLRAGQTVIGTVIEVMDITARKQAEARLRAQEAHLQELYGREQALRRDAEAANRLKDEFLAILSHELRTPMSAILGYGQLLQKRPRDADYTARTLEKIMQNARTQMQLIEDLLDMSRSITGTLLVNVAPLDLRLVIEAAIDAVRPAMEAKALVLETRLDPAAAALVGDAARLQQVVWNLLANAVKFTPAHGRITVELAALPGAVRVVVTDTGQGIRPEVLPAIFDRFRQGEQALTRSMNGLGLGLSIVRHLVELHGGTVHAASAGAGCGATLTILLPRPAPALHGAASAHDVDAPPISAADPASMR